MVVKWETVPKYKHIYFRITIKDFGIISHANSSVLTNMKHENQNLRIMFNVKSLSLCSQLGLQMFKLGVKT